MKKYLALIIVPLLFTGCGKSLDYVSLDETTMQTYEETTAISPNTQTVTVLETITPVDNDITKNTTITDTSQTTIGQNTNIIVLSEATTTLVTTFVETTPTTTTHILSAYGDEQQLVELATSLHKVACEMYWNYYNSSPYPLNYDNYIQDDYGNMFFLIDDDTITSLDDIHEDWFEIFSSSVNPNDFNGHFIEKDGKVYVNDGARGADIYYSDTKITDMVSSVDNEVTFNAVSHYINPEDGSTIEDKTYEFSIILEDNSYHVGKFTLPY